MHPEPIAMHEGVRTERAARAAHPVWAFETATNTPGDPDDVNDAVIDGHACPAVNPWQVVVV
jgi:hypothetical protein